MSEEHDAFETEVPADGADPAGALDDALRKHLDAERERTRRSMVWMVATFLFVAMLVLTLFLSLGVYMLRSSRKAAGLVEEGRTAVAAQKLEFIQISNDLQRVLRENADVGRQMRAVRAEAVKDRERLQRDLQRFGDWVNARVAVRGGGDTDSVAGEALKDRIAAAETDVAQASDGFERTAGAVAQLTTQVRSLGILVSNVAARAALQGAPRTGGAGMMDATFADLEDYLPASTNGDPFAVREVRVEPPGAEDGGETRVQVFPNGERYEGSFRDGLMHGWGSYFYANGDHYEGGFVSDLKSGVGTVSYANSDAYAGAFKNDMKHGRGTYAFRNGDRYTGVFENDMINGSGIMLYANGNKYAGGFKNGLRHGNGHLRFANGDIYKGNFVDDLRTGRGMYIFANGGRYIGEFLDGRRHGRGRYIYPEGDEYTGQWEQGRKHGQGVCVYRDGRRLEGIWHEDHLVGEQPSSAIRTNP